jgi:hypothetical protein
VHAPGAAASALADGYGRGCWVASAAGVGSLAKALDRRGCAELKLREALESILETHRKGSTSHDAQGGGNEEGGEGRDSDDEGAEEEEDDAGASGLGLGASNGGAGALRPRNSPGAAAMDTY